MNFAGGGEKQHNNNGDNFEAESSFFINQKPYVLQVKRYRKRKEEGIIFCTFQIEDVGAFANTIIHSSLISSLPILE